MEQGNIGWYVGFILHIHYMNNCLFSKKKVNIAGGAQCVF